MLDVSPPPLRHLQIDGALVFADKDLTLTAESITVAGKLQIGTEAAPFQKHAAIILTGAEPSRNQPNETKMLSVMGGVLELHGERRRVSWTRLAENAPAGSDRLRLADTADWRPGDWIAVASTDFDPAQCEMKRVLARQADEIQLDTPLRYTHWGRDEDGVSERAEVGLLTRNIVIEGDEPSKQNGYGGQIMMMDHAVAHIEGAEVTRMGQKGRLRSYPVHFHLLGDAFGSYVRDTSVHHCYNRCIAIHGTRRVRLDSNVCFDTIGHCYFFEDGNETGNIVTHNLGMMTRKARKGEEVLPTDLTPATFWVTNPNNILRGNAAAGSEQFGFWYALPKHPTGASQNARNDRDVWPRRAPLGVFSGNVSHSNEHDGLFVDGPPNPPGVTEAPDYDPHAGKAIFGPGAHAADAVFDGFVGYKNRRRGVWMRGLRLHLSHARLADNAIGVTLASSLSMVEDSLIVGETENVGFVAPGEQSGLTGRSLPKPWEPSFPIRGFEFYDGRVSVRRTMFAHFQSNTQRGAGALGYLQYSPFFVDPRNSAEALRFDDANPVYFQPMPTASPAVPGDGYRTATFVDTDGAVTGRPGVSVAMGNPFLADAHARFIPAWNAYITNAPYGRLFIDNREQPRQKIAPVIVTGANSTSQTLWGSPDAIPASFQTIVVANHGYTLRFPKGASRDLRFTLRHRMPGDFVTLTLPAPHGPFAVYAHNDFTHPIAPAADTAALDGSASGYFVSQGKMRLRLVVPAGEDRAVAEVREGE
ncbi:hypothetical protein CCAX7_22670 [Capsulimonas corticalis]|uniref:Uncharacterized protein n=1 Tax=Capsulimonas corticalis TaxID=2219043 RepID=A0A402CUV1_9BACT|nr:hypothetical protein CCAX7_22670 [Capsulimonas corticalis]